MRFIQAMFDSLWASEPVPPRSDCARYAVRALRERLHMDLHHFARHCQLPDSVISRLEGMTGYKMDDAGTITSYATASRIVWLKLIAVAEEVPWPKHASYFREQLELSIRKSHEPRRGVAR